jgi:hypothetical protein
MGNMADVLAPTLAWQLWLTLLSTTVCTCHRDLEISHRPDGKIADVLASTLASTTAADAPVNYRVMYVPQIPAIFPTPRWETHVLLVVCRAAVLLSMEAQCQS